jgi:hypothetical protein
MQYLGKNNRLLWVTQTYVYFTIIPVRYLERLPLCKYLKQSNLCPISTSLFCSPTGHTSFCVSAQYPTNNTMFSCLIFIRQTTSRSNVSSWITWAECNFLTATKPFPRSPCVISTTFLNYYVILYFHVHLYI